MKGHKAPENAEWFRVERVQEASGAFRHKLLATIPLKADLTQGEILKDLSLIWPQVQKIKVALTGGKMRLRDGPQFKGPYPVMIEESDGTIRFPDQEIAEAEKEEAKVEEELRQEEAQRKVQNHCDKVQARMGSASTRRGRKLRVDPQIIKGWKLARKEFKRLGPNGDRDAQIFNLVYIEPKYTLAEIAKQKGITRSRVSQICKKAKEFISKAMARSWQKHEEQIENSQE